MAEKLPFAVGQRVKCLYEANNGDLVTEIGRVKRFVRLNFSLQGHRWRFEVDELPGRDGQVAYLLPGEDASCIKAAGVPPLSRSAMKKLAREARKYGHFKNGVKVWLACPRCRRRVELTFSQYEGTLIKQLDAAVIRHLSDDEECVPEEGFQ
jgi:hypothetical protein